MEGGAKGGANDCFARSTGDGAFGGRWRSHSCDFPEGKGFCVRSMRWYIYQRCVGFKEHEGFFSTRLLKRELRSKTCKQILEMIGPRWI